MMYLAGHWLILIYKVRVFQSFHSPGHVSVWRLSCNPACSFQNWGAECCRSGLHRSSRITGTVACGKSRTDTLQNILNQFMKLLLDGSNFSWNSPGNILLIPVSLTITNWQILFICQLFITYLSNIRSFNCWVDWIWSDALQESRW